MCRILEHIDYRGEEPFIVNNLVKVQKKVKHHIFDFELVRCYFLYQQVKALSEVETENVTALIRNLEEGKVRRALADKFVDFKWRIISQVTAHEVGAEYIANQIEQYLTDFCRQLSLFDEEEWNIN